MVLDDILDLGGTPASVAVIAIAKFDLDSKLGGVP